MKHDIKHIVVDDLAVYISCWAENKWSLIYPRCRCFPHEFFMFLIASNLKQMLMFWLVFHNINCKHVLGFEWPDHLRLGCVHGFSSKGCLQTDSCVQGDACKPYWTFPTICHTYFSHSLSRFRAKQIQCSIRLITIIYKTPQSFQVAFLLDPYLCDENCCLSDKDCKQNLKKLMGTWSKGG